MTTHTETTPEILALLERWGSAFTLKDADGIASVFATSPDVVMITSEESVLRGPSELRAFADRYAGGSTTYSWTWDRRDVSVDGDRAWLFAEGAELASTPSGEARHPYRLTMVCEQRNGSWEIVLLHGSSPHSR